MASLAAIICAIGIAGLFLLDRGMFARAEGVALSSKPRLSAAMMVPMLWFWIAMTRPASVWLGIVPSVSPEQILDGNPVERAIMIGLIAVGLLALMQRVRRVHSQLAANLPVVFFLLYCGVSTVWSDYPDVAIKRWFRSLGDIVMLLVILTDPYPALALKWLLTRLAFLTIPLSILLMRYFSDLGRAYSRWSGETSYTGVTTNKNLMGMVCLVLGLALLAYTTQHFRRADGRREPGALLAYGATLVMLLWVLWMSRSMTSTGVLVVVAGFMLATIFMRGLRQPVLLSMTVGTLLFAAVYALILHPEVGLTGSLGRDETLTGRTELWQGLLAMVVDPMWGAGFESFWLGDRLARLWATYWWQPNEAHNGYIEIYLNLGWMGVALFALVLIAGFIRILRAVQLDPYEGSLRLGIFVAALLYNLSEAAFKMQHPLWLLLLWAIMANSTSPRRRAAREPRPLRRARAPALPVVPSMRKTGLRRTIGGH